MSAAVDKPTPTDTPVTLTNCINKSKNVYVMYSHSMPNSIMDRIRDDGGRTIVVYNASLTFTEDCFIQLLPSPMSVAITLLINP